MTQNETLRDGYPLQKVWGSSPYGCAIDYQDVTLKLGRHLKIWHALRMHFYDLTYFRFPAYFSRVDPGTARDDAIAIKQRSFAIGYAKVLVGGHAPPWSPHCEKGEKRGKLPSSCNIRIIVKYHDMTGRSWFS